MSEKQTNVQKRRVLIGQLMQEGYNSSRSIAEALREKHGIAVHRSTVARDMSQLHGESKPWVQDAQILGYEDRVRRLTLMLDDPDLTKREKLAVIRTLNDTGRQLQSLRDKSRVGKNGDKEYTGIPEEVKLKFLGKGHEEAKEKMRQEILAELREKGVEVPV
jgi:hypothetical protein